MNLQSDSFAHGAPIPPECAFCVTDPGSHATFGPNRNPHLRWSGAPEGTRSFALVCTDESAPTVGDDVNQEGRTVPADLPRADFHHWAMVDIPADCHELAAGSCSDGVTPRGKRDPAGPAGARQGKTDYTGWFAGDPDMAGDYMGYDGPAPPWNDALVHRYHFRVLALDVATVDVPRGFTAPDLLAAVEGHVLAEATLTGTYTLNPDLGA